jgi:hypothetical protein
MIHHAVIRRALRSSVLLAALPLSGCGIFRHLDVNPLATASGRPSNVAAFISVSDGETGLSELSASNFRVYENGQLVPFEQTELTLLDPNLVAAPQVVLLVDMSGAQTPEARSALAKAVQGFVHQVTRRQPVSVFAFDGGVNLVQIAAFPRGDQAVTLAALESFTSRDPSRNLNGAVMAGLRKLEQALAQNGKLIKLGTLVIYSSGPDVANRVDADQAHDAVWESPYDVIAIGVAERADAVEGLARNALIRAQSDGTLPIAFEEAASKSLEQLAKHYLVSFCSPARAGVRQLRVEVTYANPAGDELRGDFETELNAKGFGPGCNPQVTPRLTLVPKVAPPPKAVEGGKAKAEPGGVTDSRAHDQGEDAPVAPPDQAGYAK